MPAEEMENGNGHPHRWWRIVVLIAGVAILFYLARRYGLGYKLLHVQSWIKDLGPWAPLAYIVAYIVAAVTAMPVSGVTVAAGALFGSALGVLYVSIGSTLGAAASFLIARYWARKDVARWLSKYKRFRRLDKLTEKHGAIMVALTRLVPIFPFALLNFGFGLTSVGFWSYLFWSWLCMLPGTVLFVVGADAVFRAIAENRIPWTLIIVLLVTSALMAGVAWLAQHHLEAKESEMPHKNGEEEGEEAHESDTGDFATR